MQRKTPSNKKPCFDFARGRCGLGPNCTYSHDQNLQCPHYNTPRGCLKRKQCPFSHENRSVPTSIAIPTQPISSARHEESELDISCRQWTYLIPRTNSNLRHHAQPVDTKRFFKMGWDLIAREDAETRQHIITKLGGETGLVMVKALADLMVDGQSDDTIISIFKERSLPFYRMISYPDVLSSLILETPLDCIYTFLFGPNGRRALNVFRFTATAISGLILSHSPNDEELSIIAITSSLNVLQRLIDINQSAQVIEDFVPIVEAIAACIPEHTTLPAAMQTLARIRNRLNIGASFPVASNKLVTQVVHHTAFDLSQDLPGNLSNVGSQHDNDHTSISDIQILPTVQEITSNRQEYLPSTNAAKHHLPGLPGLLDRHFRLLREDTVGQLRDAVRIELTRLEHPKRLPSGQNQGSQGIRNIIYTKGRTVDVIAIPGAAGGPLDNTQLISRGSKTARAHYQDKSFIIGRISGEAQKVLDT